jgi:outer membrane receptor protein involved in Fe transport
LIFSIDLLKVITTTIDNFYVDILVDQPNKIMNISLGYDYKGFSGRVSMLYKTDVFTKTDFWPELRESTDDYKRWDLSIKQKLPIEGFELFFNANNFTESTDISQLRGSLNKKSSEPSMTLEQYYGKTFDLGFRFYF